ncbi:MAG: molybdenum cofactor guanylyltransferase [Dehalococcoidia bacterium]|nr:molybdenum cofactor guanylyltransferase [Dehalococcoidia bacterium]MCK5654270.1 molybdenum cofactor guanylyltransferase [Dehalococcoidia bacterium]
MTSIVLAGGESLRFGREKALEEMGGRSLIERVIERLSLLGNEIIVVTSSSNQLPDLGVKMVIDSYQGKGNLVGIYSGLKDAASSHALVVGCDMPFLNVALLRHLTTLSPGFDVVIPKVADELEPLHAVYSKNCLAPIEATLGEGKRRIVDFFPTVRVRYVEKAEIERFDPQHLSFFNINSEADLERARMLLEREAP